MNKKSFEVNYLGDTYLGDNYLGHSYWLFNGDEMTGKTMLANLIKKEESECYNVGSIKVFENIMNNIIKYYHENAGTNENAETTFIFITNDIRVASYIKEYFWKGI